jgi:hypothetical protein
MMLRLYTRKGCCLCEGLRERLAALEQAPLVCLVDVDEDSALQARFGNEVPVLAVLEPGSGERLLERVPPRLQGDRLQEWLLRQFSKRDSA